MKTLLWTRSRRGLLNNSNHSTTKAEIPTIYRVENPNNMAGEEPETFRVDLSHPEGFLWIGSGLHPHEKLFKQFLLENSNVFAWSPTDMPGIGPEVIYHKLSIKVDVKPVKQKPRRMNEEKSRAISDKVNRLLQAGFIRDVLSRLAL